MESYLEMAIRTSSANSDPFKDDVTCSLSPFGLIEQLIAIRNIRGALGQNAFGLSQIGSQVNNNNKYEKQTGKSNLKVIEAFTLEYKLKWPLTLILSHKSITKYSLIFRHLLNCKYVERTLESLWLLHQTTKEFKVHGV